MGVRGCLSAVWWWYICLDNILMCERERALSDRLLPIVDHSVRVLTFLGRLKLLFYAIKRIFLLDNPICKKGRVVSGDFTRK